MIISKDFSEKNFQHKFVDELTKYKWTAPEKLNGNIHEVTVQDLIDNWRDELNRINADQLEGVPLTDNEFKQVLFQVNQINNSYDAARKLAAESGKGKIDSIHRDDNPKIVRKQITLTIFEKNAVGGGYSSYEIAREVKTNSNKSKDSKTNRFDLVLLINGLPLINIELKRTDKTLDEAFGQFKRYYSDGEFSNNFMAFSQMMIIASEIETRYFATPKSLEEFNPAFVFHWADKNNRLINGWQEVIEKFLMIPMAHQMVGDYLVIDEAENAEDRRHMLLRPYQVYALQAIEGAAIGFDNPDRVSHGGFIWHTTGSGKTITSFKTALFLSSRAGFDKVIFLVDRRELDSKTNDNFKAYAKFETVEVDDTISTYILKNKLKDPNHGIVVTTTFKLHMLVKELHEKKDLSLKGKKIVFIIDEAHRTTMGQMMGTIKDYFKANSIFFGFTGTPLFEENNAKGMINQKSEVINTTEKLFGNLLHQYTIDEAIKDGNVLGFNVDYINTGEFISYEQLKESLVELKIDNNPNLNQREIERSIYKLSDLDVEREAVKEGLLVYNDETHIPRVVEEIIKNWDKQSQNNYFNAILTVAYKERVIKYYQEFKKQLKDSNLKLNIALTFSLANENDTDTNEKSIILNMFEDYEKYTGIDFTSKDIHKSYKNYFEDLVSRSSRGGSGINPQNIDLVIVADQLLTGYDSKKLNTLYVDRNLELQGLIQAYSRTNRVFGDTKEFGTIINFKYPKITEDSVDTALKLYGSGGKNGNVIVEPYPFAVAKFSVSFKKLKNILDNPQNWDQLKLNTEKLSDFKKKFKRAQRQMNLIQQYYEYTWNDNLFGTSENEWNRYIGVYKNLLDRKVDGDDPVFKPLIGKTKLVSNQIIDAAHILRLIGTETVDVKGYKSVTKDAIEMILEQIKELSLLGEHIQAELLQEFVNSELINGKIPSNIDFDKAYKEWKDDRKEKDIYKYAEDWGINPSLLSESIESYNLANPTEVPFIDEIHSSLNFEEAKNKKKRKINHTMELIKDLPNWIYEIKEKYE